MKTKLRFQKTASLFLAFLMILSTLAVLPFSAAAELTDADWKETTVGGKTVIEIGTKAGLLNFLTELKGTSAEDPADKFVDKTVKLTADIDMAGATWNSVYNYNSSDVTYFNGTFDGQGHKISNLSISGAGNLGFVHTLNGATIQNIVFENASVTSTGARNGVIAVQVYTNGATFNNVFIRGTVTGNKTATSTMTGGFVGNVRGPLTVMNCVSIVDVTGFTGVGGFFGHVDIAGDVTMSDCIYTGSVISDYHSGGFVGRMSGNIDLIRCVSNATLSAGNNYNTMFLYANNQSLQNTSSYSKDNNCTINMTDCYATIDSGSHYQLGSHTGASLGVFTLTISYTGEEDKVFEPLLGSHNESFKTVIKTIDTANFDFSDYSALTNWVYVDADGDSDKEMIPASVAKMLDKCPIPTTDVYYQEQKNGDGTKDVRFVAVIDDLRYANVGFNVTITRDNESIDPQTAEITKNTTTVYKTVKALDKDVSAETLGGKYLYVIEIQGVDVANYDHTFTVSAFVTMQDGTVLEFKTPQTLEITKGAA